jgi:hypothetical protein
MALADHNGATDGYEQVPLRPGRAGGAAPPAAAMVLLRRRSPRPTRRGVLHLRTARDSPAPPDLASWFTERGFHFYVAAVRWPRPARGPALAAAFTDLDTRCQHLRAADGIDNVIVTAHGEGALAAVRWCASPLPGSQPDALVLYAPAFGRAVPRGLDIRCPVLVIGGSAGRGPLRRAPTGGTVHLGRHVTWLHGADDGTRPDADREARPDARDPADRTRFFDELGRWLGAYMYGQVRDQLL